MCRLLTVNVGYQLCRELGEGGRRGVLNFGSIHGFCPSVGSALLFRWCRVLESTKCRSNILRHRDIHKFLFVVPLDSYPAVVAARPIRRNVIFLL